MFKRLIMICLSGTSIVATAEEIFLRPFFTSVSDGQDLINF
jgi:hypothetical protein